MVGEIGLRPQRCSSSGMGRLRKSPAKVLAVVKGEVPMVVRGSSTGKLVGSGGGFRLPVDMVNFLFLFLAQSPGWN
jgi:hypothetical protein